MSDKIPQGRPCWTTFGCLREGVVVFHDAYATSDTSIVRYEGGDENVLTYSFIFFTREGAKRQCEENAEYWQRKADEL